MWYIIDSVIFLLEWRMMKKVRLPSEVANEISISCAKFNCNHLTNNLGKCVCVCLGSSIKHTTEVMLHFDLPEACF